MSHRRKPASAPLIPAKIDLDFSAQPHFANLGVIGTRLQNAGLIGRGLQIGITVPQAVMTSFYHELDANARRALLGNLGWQQWSKFDNVDISVATTTPASLTMLSKYKDTWHAALGAQYQYSEPWLLSGGIACDSAMVNDVDRSIALPAGPTWAFGVGARYKVRDGYDVSFNYELKYAVDLPVDQPMAAASWCPALLANTATLHCISSAQLFTGATEFAATETVFCGRHQNDTEQVCNHVARGAGGGVAGVRLGGRRRR